MSSILYKRMDCSIYKEGMLSEGMVFEYNCPRCNYSTPHKQHFMYHLKKKLPCHPIHSDIPIEDVIAQCSMKQTRSHMCTICDKSFSHLSSLSRHRKEHHSNTLAHATADAPVVVSSTKSNSENSHRLSNCHNVSNTTDSYNHITNNNNSTNTTTNNDNSTNNSNNTVHIGSLNVENISINILPFGKEDMSGVENNKEFLTKCLQELLLQGIPNVIEKIFFNQELPQNNNVKLRRSAYPTSMLVYAQENDSEPPQWEERDLHQTLDQMIDKGYAVLFKHNNQLYCIDKEIIDLRNDKLAKVKGKKRGVYGSIKQGVLLKARQAKSKNHEARSDSPDANG